MDLWALTNEIFKAQTRQLVLFLYYLTTLLELFRTLLASCFVLVSCLTDSCTLKMKRPLIFKGLYAKDRTLHNDRSDLIFNTRI